MMNTDNWCDLADKWYSATTEVKMEQTPVFTNWACHTRSKINKNRSNQSQHEKKTALWQRARW